MLIAFKAHSYSAISALNGLSHVQFSPLKEAKTFDLAMDDYKARRLRARAALSISVCPVKKWSSVLRRDLMALANADEG